MQIEIFFRRLLLISITLGSFAATSRELEKKSNEVSKKDKPKIIYATPANEIKVSKGIITVDYNEFPLGNQLDNYDMSNATFIADGKAYSAKLKGTPERYRDPDCNRCSKSAEYQMKYNFTIPGVDKMSEKFDFAIFGSSKITEILPLKVTKTKVDSEKLLLNLKSNWILSDTSYDLSKFKLVYNKKSPQLQILKKSEVKPGRFEESVVNSFAVKNCKFSKYEPFILAECYSKDPETVKMSDFQFPEANFFFENGALVILNRNESYVRPSVSFSIGNFRYVVVEQVNIQGGKSRIYSVGGRNPTTTIEAIENWH